LKGKQFRPSVVEFIKEETKKKSIATGHLVERLEDKFGQKFDYMSTHNIQREIDSQFFGEPSDDAECLKNLLQSLKTKFPDMLVEILAPNNTLEGVIYSTPSMKDLADNYLDLCVMDTTFNTNRFRMKYWAIAGKDNCNKTIIFAEGLIRSETKENLVWLLSCIKDYFKKSPKLILIDADPALISACETVFPNSKIKLCGWHTESNIKNHLYGSKKSKLLLVYCV
jgi:hypothetical protein